MEVSKVQLANGEVLVDLTNDSVTEETLAEGATAHDASGARITGTMKGGGGVSVQADWNQTDETAADFIKNKPFGEAGGDTLTVAIESEDDLANYLIVGDVLAKVSDSAPTMADLANGVTLDVLGEIMHIPAELVPEVFFEDVEGLVASDATAFVSEQAVGVDLDGMAFPEAGTYIFTDLMFGFSITIPSYTGYTGVKTLDPKYLPRMVLYAKGDDRYLYTDAACTIKATMYDVPESEYFKIGLTEAGVVGAWLPPLIFASRARANKTGFCDIQTAVTTYYTAEYTPET